MSLCIFTNDLQVSTRSFVRKLASSLLLKEAPPYDREHIRITTMLDNHVDRYARASLHKWDIDTC
jgi:hypothetical protein